MIDGLTRRKLIESLLAEFLSDLGETPELRGAARRNGALPLFRDMGGCYAIRPDGTLVSWSWDEPDQVCVEKDARIWNIALFAGSERWVELASLIPSRPVNAKVCDSCDGTGRLKGLPDELAQRIRCYCGGIGWLPAGA
ncbi:MAG: hypothetical protein JWN70_703 [Planctomycetaceae bacterium]|nr:hypothetical protein [Planctomycetaceae bacterium]